MTTYVLTFPYDVQPEAVSAFVTALSGLSGSMWFGMPNGPTIAFELLATDRGILHRLRVPSKYASYVGTELRALVPGVRVDVLRDDPTATHDAPEEWQHAVEIGATRPSQSLRIADVSAVSATVLASAQPLHRGEAVLLQLVVMPIRPEKPPSVAVRRPMSPLTNRWSVWRAMSVFGPQAAGDELRDRRDKLSEPNLLGVLRVAARSRPTESQPDPVPRAVQLVERLGHALRAVNSPYTALRRRPVPVRVACRRATNATGLLVYPLQLSASELAIIGWPLGGPNVPGLPAPRSRQIPATEVIPRTGGKVVAISNVPGAHRPLVLRPVQACQHLCTTGPVGVGKTTLLSSLLAQDAARGHGICMVESKGDLFRLAVDLIPQHRLDDTIILDVTDRSRPVGFNVLADGEPGGAVERICGVFEQLYHDTRSVWVRDVLYMGLCTLARDPRYTFVDLAPLLHPLTETESDWRAGVIRSVTDKELANFWRRFIDLSDAAQQRMAQPVMDRIWQLNARPDIRNIIGQSVSSFDMRDVVRDGKLLLVNLAGLPETTAALVGTLMLSSLWSAVQAVGGHGGLPQPYFLYLDEFQSFLNLPLSPQEMLVKARSFKLGMVLAHQNLQQLPFELRAAVQANCRSKVVFQLSSDDAHSFAREFGRLVTADDFMTLGAYEVIWRLATDAGVSQPVTAVTQPPATPTGLATTVLNRSRNRYGRPIRDVEREIEGRRSALADRKRPTVGPIPWNGDDNHDQP